jgi:hypothetical protein
MLALRGLMKTNYLGLRHCCHSAQEPMVRAA